MKKSLLLLLLISWAGFSSRLHAQELLDPLRGAKLTKRIAGPELKPEALKGKVVLLEYWGYH